MYPYIDMHCDSLLRVLNRGNASLYNGEGMQSIQKMVESGQMCQFFAIFFAPEVEKEESYFTELRDALLQQVNLHKEKIGMVYNAQDLLQNWQEGRASAILSIEDGRMVQGRIYRLQYLYKQGVRALTLTWNHANCFGYPNSRDWAIMQKGLTRFGKEAIEEMNRLGMLIDVSHLSDGGFWDVAKISQKPFIASHSNCRALVNHPRNLSDDMLRALAARGGVVGVNCYPVFAGGGEVEDLAKHVLHMVKIGGEDLVGIGTDFDGFEAVAAIDSPSRLEALFGVLKKTGLTERQVEKLAGGNVLRVIKEVL